MTSEPSAPARFQDVQPVLPVRDLAAALTFYIERLGFHFLFGDRGGAPADADPDGNGLTFYRPRQGLIAPGLMDHCVTRS